MCGSSAWQWRNVTVSTPGKLHSRAKWRWTVASPYSLGYLRDSVLGMSNSGGTYVCLHEIPRPLVDALQPFRHRRSSMHRRRIFTIPASAFSPSSAARVMAWRREQAVESVTSKSSGHQKDETVWNIVWRDKAGAALREATVQYRERSCSVGRTGIAACAAARGTVPIKGTGAGATSQTRFEWTTDAGVSRMEGVACGDEARDAASKSLRTRANERLL